MKRRIRLFLALIVSSTTLLWAPLALAAGIAPSSGGSHTVGTTFTVKIVASGTTFNAFQGKISVSGPVSASISPGSASWAPGGTPTIGGTFQGGITSPSSSFTIATLSLRGTSVGSGSVSVSGVELVNNGSIVATGGGSASFTINRAATPPGVVAIGSSTNPDQNQDYGVTSATLTWAEPENGATGYSTAFDQTADTTPAQTVTTKDLTATYNDLKVGVYYFHIRAVNNDGWGPANHYRIGITQARDDGLKAPQITSVQKLPGFKNDVALGTVTNFIIRGQSAGLTGYAVTLAVAPGDRLSADQKLTSPVAADGSWSVTFDQPAPTGFYKITPTAKNDTTSAPDGQPVNVELSVANGGTAKIVTAKDLPQPDLTVKVAGVTFKDRHYYLTALWSLIALGLLIAAVAVSATLFGPRLYRRLLRRGESGAKDSKPPLKL